MTKLHDITIGSKNPWIVKTYDLSNSILDFNIKLSSGSTIDASIFGPTSRTYWTRFNYEQAFRILVRDTTI